MLDRSGAGIRRQARAVSALLVACCLALRPSPAVALERLASPWQEAWAGPFRAVSGAPISLSPLAGTTAVRASEGPHPAPGMVSGDLAAGDTVTIHVFTDTLRSRVVLTNPSGITGVEDYASGNYRQTVLSRAADRVEMEIVSDRFLGTRAPFPTNEAILPPEATEALVARPGWIQADDPAIMTAAASLTSGTTTQAQAVEAIVAYVRGHVVYDSAGPRDALSVLQTGRAYCVGFANLAMALLRAVRIPARGQYGCAAPWDGWGSPVQGGRHMWIEVYYPDAGWVASDPQASANFVDTAHLLGFLDQCAKDGTTIQRTEYSGTLGMQDPGYLHSVTTQLASASGIPLYAAAVSAPPAAVLVVQPADVAVSLSPDSPLHTFALEVSATAAPCAGWRIESRATWLVLLNAAGTAPGQAQVEVNGRSVTAGTYVGTLQVYADPATSDVAPRTVTVTMHMAADALSFVPPDDQTHRIPIPLILNRSSF